MHTDVPSLLSNDAGERAQLQAWAVEYAEGVQDLLARIPKPLLLL
jgi:hypothetical protein